MGDLAFTLLILNKLKESENLFRECLKLMQKIHNLDHPDIAEAKQNQAQNLTFQNNLKEAEKLLRECLEIKRIFYKIDHHLIM